ncbi:hypothetical protein AB4455_03600 [Vibrio sp. 10N.261.46.E12]|uniref:hypothetical protein n=1 Tax=unclassified Vibrio TaxID=2614977 RepID=UPI000C84B11C|nr:MULTISPECIES: hypothetical protein [unclassified Vibrio]PML84262.1 hypothetical protein BCT66_17700 [Vibrio sp. 10N.261.49.E11]PMN84391.1 hypothetical protein BCT22_11250 [Vibrio sp. 10N.261.45.A1]
MSMLRQPNFSTGVVALHLSEIEILNPDLIEQLDHIIDHSTATLRMNYLESVIQSNEQEG